MSAAALDTSTLIHEALLGSWVQWIACHDADPEDFAPIAGTKAAKAEVALRRRTARTYCKHCPVRPQCAQWADEIKEVGVWGGALRYKVANGKYVVKPLVGR